MGVLKLALLKGNRFNAWHLGAFNQIEGQPAVTAFRAESEIQEYFHQRDDGSVQCAFERIYFDTQSGAAWKRALNILGERYFERSPRILPFHDRLKGFDLVQSWELFTDWTAEAVEAKKKYGVPLAIMVWDNIPFNMERNAARRHMKERAAAHADRFIVHTDRSLRTLDLEGISLERVVKIAPGVDIEAFSPGVGDRAALGLDEEAFVLLFVGWLLPRKGIDFLILALRELTKDPALKSFNFQLLVVGSGPGQDRVEALIDRLQVRPCCTLAGSLPYGGMANAYRSADVCVLPSIATPEWQEQFGMALLEAMACGTPVVSTYSGAIPEIAGDAAILCQPNDFVSLHGAIRDMVLEPAKRNDLGGAGRVRAEECYSLETFAARLSQVYGDILAT